MVHYCSDACKRGLSTVHTQDDCKTLRLLRATERTQIDYHIARKKPAVLEDFMSVTPHARRPYIPLSHYADFGQFHRAISMEYSSSPDVTFMYRLLASTFHHHDPMVIPAIDQMASEAESIPLTVIAGLEASIPNISTRPTLEIHFVAASTRELSTRAITEEILHHFPALRKLVIHYVGPEATVPGEALARSPNLACSSCKSRGASRHWELHATEYHHFLKANPEKRPDLIVGLNTGWSEMAQAAWAKTFDSISVLGAPVLFTEYSQREARGEEKLLRARGAHFMVPMQENRWKGVIPIVNKGVKLNHGKLASYSSYYWYVFRL
ncbi:hypothetical protein FB45DRAFT_832460 [Roridomyces roridus]|uniref:Mitochondrial splicing suppressor 51-like C-terminal domain-containing protein n=1 Tax=Roridomyces roridus TaxID=1738132 RepID=A0AAD7BXC5_9AGAR|nr:hypothetical protein FB45DRAFT_832460 [Roridomyces roridus]